MILSIKKILLRTLFISTLGMSAVNAGTTNDSLATLSFSDGRETIANLNEINTVLHTIGVHLSTVSIPKEVIEILRNRQGINDMTLISGGPWTYFFMLKDNVVVKLSLNRIPLNSPGWRINYSAKIPPPAFMVPQDG